MKALVLAVLAACSGPASDDIVGPFPGRVRRFAIDTVALPQTSEDASGFADDLDGDGDRDDKLGLATVALALTNDLSQASADAIAAGALASTLELAGDDDARLGATFRGAPDDPDDTATACGGALVDGAFASNRTRTTRHPCRARVRLPIFASADPVPLPLDGVELDLAADPDHPGALVGYVRGGIPLEDARAAAYAGVLQMIADEPTRHLVFARGVDTDGDGAISRAESDDSIVGILVSADIRLYRGATYAPEPGATAERDSVSVAFAIHATPCPDDPAAPCTAVAPTAIVDRCRDRVRDGDETDVDCGGGCAPCHDGAACALALDCQSAACDQGRCRVATCTDGVRDGLESDRDCGGICGPCAAGAVCAAAADCTSAHCDGVGGATGHCQ